MRFQVNYWLDEENKGFIECLDIDLTEMELQEKFGWGNPLISPRNSPQWKNFVRWITNNYLPKAYYIETISRIS